MKIGIDIRRALGRKAGKGWYTFHVVKELLALDRKNTYLLYTDRLSEEASVFQGAHIKVITKRPSLWHFAVIADFKKEEGNLFFAPTSYLIPAFLPREIRSVVTVHDLIAVLFPELHTAKTTILENFFLRLALKKTSHVLTVSENTKRDLLNRFRMDEDRVTVTPLAASETFFQPRNEKELEDFRKEKNLPKEFLLTVGTLEPRKNLKLILEIFPEIQRNFPHIQSVVVGNQGWKMHEKIQRSFLWFENLSLEELSKLYRLAKVFVFPSLYEGFGLPPLEALASGCPVVCSNAASLPEVTGDSAILLPPTDRTSWISAVSRVLTDEKLQTELSEKGQVHARKFSWKKTAEKTLQGFGKILL